MNAKCNQFVNVNDSNAFYLLVDFKIMGKLALSADILLVILGPFFLFFVHLKFFKKSLLLTFGALITSKNETQIKRLKK